MAKNISLKGTIETLRRNEADRKRIEWRPYQEEVFRVMDETKKHIFVSMGRRLGKDYHIFYKAVQECLKNPNYRVYYFFPVIAQGLRAIKDGVTNENESWLDSVLEDDSEIIKAKSGSYFQWDNVLYFRNGSSITMLGADQASTKVGSNVNLIIMSEAAHYKNLKVMINRLLPSVTKIGGRLILISTPLYGSYFNKMQLEGLDPDEWHSAIVPATEATEKDGSPVYTEKELDMMRAVMSEEEFRQEMMCDFNSPNSSSILGRSMELATYVSKHNRREGRIYVSVDLGINDNTVIVFSQQVGTKIRVLDMYARNGMPTKHFTDYIHRWIEREDAKNRYSVVLPHDSVARQRGFETTASTYDQFKKAGLNVELVRRTNVIGGIEILRTAIQNGNLEFLSCGTVMKLVNKMKQYMWDTDANGESIGVPFHGKQADDPSNYVDAVRYIAIFKFGEMRRQGIYKDIMPFYE